MYLGLNYTNADYIVSKYNSMLYIDSKIKTVETFNNLSLSAAEPLCSLNINYNDGISDDYTVMKYNNIKDKYKAKIIMKNKWQQWNAAKYKAEKVLF